MANVMNQILIAEDESRLAAFVEKGLRQYGYETIVAEDGCQALAITQTEEIKLLLLDLGLPIKDGWTVLKELRSQGKQFPIIVITAFSDDKSRAVALAAGATDYRTHLTSYGT
ncbi:MAG: response regulator [Thermosynechococcaceae cyanobacterium MS004]|nr:response regulator [Thermosynechococcaceae cyanobacterium MS004]